MNTSPDSLPSNAVIPNVNFANHEASWGITGAAGALTVEAIAGAQQMYYLLAGRPEISSGDEIVFVMATAAVIACSGMWAHGVKRAHRAVPHR